MRGDFWTVRRPWKEQLPEMGVRRLSSDLRGQLWEEPEQRGESLYALL